ncbi:MAG: hypothetical protein NTV92_06245, partial [Candidatus Bipolaricaulota bacterium]|nr:hypothetical protein [Candidatus Bipolaricaulota bacterium]
GNVAHLFNSSMFGPAALAATASNHWIWRDNRSNMMPNHMEAFKIAKEQGMNLRSLVVPMVIALVLATAAGFGSMLHVIYKEGAMAGCEPTFPKHAGGEAFHNWLSGALSNGFQPDATRWGVTIFSAGFVIFLSWLRECYSWFPFHPLGFCLSFGMGWHWVPFLIAWICKFSILRIGGLNLYRQVMPFFLGLILGDYVMGAFWSLIGVIYHVSYRRAFLLGLILMPINVYWVIAAELRFDLVMSLNPLFITPVFYLFVLWFVNLLIEKLFPKYILKPHELVVIYVMLVMSCTIASVDYLINLISLMPWPQHLAETYPAFIKPALPYLPKWLFVWDRQVVKDLFSGDATVFSYRVLRAWLPPLGFWLIFITASCWIMLCMTVMIRKAWMENVKLSYPIVRLPFAMTERNTPASLMRSHVMWFGFGIAAFLGILKQLNHWYPSIVSIQTLLVFKQDLSGFQSIPPLGAQWGQLLFRFIHLISA